MSQTDDAIRRAQELAQQGKQLGDEFKTAPAAVQEKATAAWTAANNNKK